VRPDAEKLVKIRCHYFFILAEKGVEVLNAKSCVDILDKESAMKSESVRRVP
jgi:hypothetical protein